MTVTIEDFRNAVSNHRAAQHPFFAFLKDKAKQGGFNGVEFQVFAANYLARTVFTIMEVAAGAKAATFDGRPIATAYSAATLLEEAGGNSPEANHPQLMADAFNRFGKMAYGDAYTPIDFQELRNAITRFPQVWNDVAVQQQLEHLESKPIVSALHVLFDKGFLRRNVNLGLSSRSHQSSADSIDELNQLAAVFQKYKIDLSVVHYAMIQHAVMADTSKGALAGFNYAHETLADDMMLNLFMVMRSTLRGRPELSKQFDEEVYPYFAAHGDYKAIAEGIVTGAESNGVEAQHAQREEAKIQELIAHDPSQAITALHAATAFADVQAGMWDWMLKNIKSATVAANQALPPLG